MKKIGIFYGTTSGNTTGIVDEIEFYLRKDDYQTYNVADGISEIKDYEILFLYLLLMELENYKKIGTIFLKSLKI